MKKQIQIKSVILGLGLIGLFGLLIPGSCARKPKVQMGNVGAAALATYVAPYDTDEYYLFYSGGHSGNVFIASVPLM